MGICELARLEAALATAAAEFLHRRAVLRAREARRAHLERAIGELDARDELAAAGEVLVQEGD